MKITVLIIGLALAAGVCGQSLMIVSRPFVTPEFSGPASAGIVVAILLVVGAAFAMSILRVSAAALGLGGVLAYQVGDSTSFSDLKVWGVIALGCAALALYADQGNKLWPILKSIFDHRSNQQVAASALATEAADVFLPVAAPLTGQGDSVSRIERLAALWASGGLSDEEFAILKADAIGRAQK